MKQSNGKLRNQVFYTADISSLEIFKERDRQISVRNACPFHTYFSMKDQGIHHPESEWGEGDILTDPLSNTFL